MSGNQEPVNDGEQGRPGARRRERGRGRTRPSTAPVGQPDEAQPDLFRSPRRGRSDAAVAGGEESDDEFAGEQWQGAHEWGKAVQSACFRMGDATFGSRVSRRHWMPEFGPELFSSEVGGLVLEIKLWFDRFVERKRPSEDLTEKIRQRFGSQLYYLIVKRDNGRFKCLAKPFSDFGWVILTQVMRPLAERGCQLLKRANGQAARSANVSAKSLSGEEINQELDRLELEQLQNAWRSRTMRDLHEGNIESELRKLGESTADIYRMQLELVGNARLNAIDEGELGKWNKTLLKFHLTKLRRLDASFNYVVELAKDYLWARSRGTPSTDTLIENEASAVPGDVSEQMHHRIVDVCAQLESLLPTVITAAHQVQGLNASATDLVDKCAQILSASDQTGAKAALDTHKIDIKSLGITRGTQCYKCGLDGHKMRSSSCPLHSFTLTSRCPKCNCGGHTSMACLTASSKEFLHEPLNSFVTVNINGMKAKGLKDSGSKNSYISVTLLHTLFQSNWCTWHLLDTKAIMCVISLDKYQGMHKVYIFEECASDTFVLGRDVLEAAAQAGAES